MQNKSNADSLAQTTSLRANLTPVQAYRLERSTTQLSNSTATPSLIFNKQSSSKHEWYQLNLVSSPTVKPTTDGQQKQQLEQRHTLTVKILNHQKATSKSCYLLEVFVHVISKRKISATLDGSHERLLAKEFKLDFPKFISFSVPVSATCLTGSPCKDPILEFKVVVSKNKSCNLRREVLLGFKQFSSREKKQTHSFDFVQRNALLSKRVEIELTLETRERPVVVRPAISPFHFSPYKSPVN